LALAHAGMMSMLAPFWSLTTSSLSGTAAAGGIAFINSVGNLGGFVGPSIIGPVVAETGSFTYGFLALAGVLVIGCVLVLQGVRDRKAD
jgi:MFS transporter, ACS family, tartrate transporter